MRAAYLYSGVADVANETKNLDYQSATLSLWDNFVNKNYYLTGGAGSGATAEGFGDNYILPNGSYCETCAGCGTLFFFHKLNLAYQDAKFADLMENVLYNEVLGAVDDQGSNIFYPNPLSGGGRDSWTGVPCCSRQLCADRFGTADVDLYPRHQCHLDEHVHRQHHDDFQYRGRHGADGPVHRLSVDQH